MVTCDVGASLFASRKTYYDPRAIFFYYSPIRTSRSHCYQNVTALAMTRHSSPGLYKKAALLHWGLVSAAQHRFTHGLNVICSLRIRSGTTFIWQASSLGDAQFLRPPVYLQ